MATLNSIPKLASSYYVEVTALVVFIGVVTLYAMYSSMRTCRPEYLSCQSNDGRREEIRQGALKTGLFILVMFATSAIQITTVGDLVYGLNVSEPLRTILSRTCIIANGLEAMRRTGVIHITLPRDAAWMNTELLFPMWSIIVTVSLIVLASILFVVEVAISHLDSEYQIWVGWWAFGVCSFITVFILMTWFKWLYILFYRIDSAGGALRAFFIGLVATESALSILLLVYIAKRQLGTDTTFQVRKYEQDKVYSVSGTTDDHDHVLVVLFSQFYFLLACIWYRYCDLGSPDVLASETLATDLSFDQSRPRLRITRRGNENYLEVVQTPSRNAVAIPVAAAAAAAAAADRTTAAVGSYLSQSPDETH